MFPASAVPPVWMWRGSRPLLHFNPLNGKFGNAIIFHLSAPCSRKGPRSDGWQDPNASLYRAAITRGQPRSALTRERAWHQKNRRCEDFKLKNCIRLPAGDLQRQKVLPSLSSSAWPKLPRRRLTRTKYIIYTYLSNACLMVLRSMKLRSTPECVVFLWCSN